MEAMLDEEEAATNRRCKTKPLLFRLYIGEVLARNLTNGSDARRRKGCDEAAIQDEAAFSCETTARKRVGERVIKRFNFLRLVMAISFDR